MSERLSDWVSERVSKYRNQCWNEMRGREGGGREGEWKGIRGGTDGVRRNQRSTTQKTAGILLCEYVLLR